MIWRYKNSNLTIVYTNSFDGILKEDGRATNKTQFYNNFLGEMVEKSEIFQEWESECFPCIDEQEILPLPQRETLIEKSEIQKPQYTTHNAIPTKTTAPRNNPHPMPEKPETKFQELHIPNDAIKAFLSKNSHQNVKTFSTNLKTPKNYSRLSGINLKTLYRMIQNEKVRTLKIDDVIFINEPPVS